MRLVNVALLIVCYSTTDSNVFVESCSDSPRIISISSPVCVGQEYYLQCTYPDLQTCGYLPTILWQRNGVDIHPHSGSPEIATFHNSTTALLETTYNSLEPLEYRCYYHDGSDTHFSNEVAVDYIHCAYLSISASTVCYDRQVQLTCHHHDINDTISSESIFSQTSPVVWMKDVERIDLPDAYHMVVSQSKTETVVSVTTRKSVFLNGEANYSCAVVYADGSMEESEPVTVRVRAGIPSESPLPPTSLTSVSFDTSISLMWSHSDECFENCTFMYEVTWQQSGDGSSLRNTTTTETSYTIEGLTPGTSYEIGVGAYCKEDPSIASGNVTQICKLPTDSDSQACFIWWCIWFPVLVIVCIIILVIIGVIFIGKVNNEKRKNSGAYQLGHSKKEETSHANNSSPDRSTTDCFMTQKLIDDQVPCIGIYSKMNQIVTGSTRSISKQSYLLSESQNLNVNHDQLNRSYKQAASISLPYKALSSLFMCYLLFYVPLGEGMPTLQGPSTPVCFGEVYVLSCSHPQLEGSDYLPGVFWKMNGGDLHPDGKDIISRYINGTLANLHVSIAKSQFGTENVSFACYLFNSATLKQNISNTLTFSVIMVPTPNNFRIYHRLNKLILSWDLLLISDCYREDIFLFNVTLYNEGTSISTTSTSTKSYDIPEQFQSSDYSIVLVAYQPENVDVTSENVTISISGLGTLESDLSKNLVCFDSHLSVSCKHQISKRNIQNISIYNSDQTLLDTTNNIMDSSSVSFNIAVTRDDFTGHNTSLICTASYNSNTTDNKHVNIIEGSIPVIVKARDIFQPVDIVHETSPGTIQLSWVHFNNCTINCTITFEIIWQQIKDGSTSTRATTTETSYTISNLGGGTYGVALTTFCKENLLIRSDTVHLTDTEVPVDLSVVLGISLALGISAIIIIIIMIPLICMCIYCGCCKKCCKSQRGSYSLTLEAVN